jgi:flagellar biosynthesis protein FlhG
VRKNFLKDLRKAFIKDQSMSMHAVQVVAVTGGKGGVGKTNVSVNLSISLSNLGRRVVLLDADLGLANVDILLGISAKRTLEDVLKGECTLAEVLVDGPKGIKIVPAASGTQYMVQLNAREHGGLINAFNDIADDIDVLVIDTAAGISDTVVSFVRAAQETLVVVCDEPTSITDAYAMIKMLHQQYDMQRFHVVANMVRSTQEAQALYQKLVRVTNRFLDISLIYAGGIPFDENLRKAVQKQKAVCELFPRSPASQAFHALAKKINQWPLPSAPRGHLEFFVERLLDRAVI